MEIEIESKRNNPLLNRTEVYFIVRHPGEGTPNREIIRSELADKLNVKKENIIVNTVKSGFGIQEISGYAKVYSSVQKTKDLEQDYILARNKLIEVDKKAKKEAAPPISGEGAPKPAEDKKQEEPIIEEPAKEVPEQTNEPEPPVEEKPETQKDEKPVEQPMESKSPDEEPKQEEKSSEEKSEEKEEPEKTKEDRKEE